jgi:hypothetical protein
MVATLVAPAGHVVLPHDELVLVLQEDSVPTAARGDDASSVPWQDDARTATTEARRHDDQHG